MSFLFLILVLSALFGGFTIYTTEPSTSVTPVTTVPLLDSILKEYEKQLGPDFVPYRNHCYRVYNIALTMFPKPPTKHVQDVFAIAVAFHDLGIWTDSTIDYLPPSNKLAENWLKKQGKETDVELVYLLIENHHKVTSYNGKFEDLVEIFRKADWIDFSLTIRNFGIDRSEIFGATAPFPNAGFHMVLTKALIQTILKLQYPLPMFKL